MVTIKFQDMYVDVKAENFRTRVQLPPPPPSHSPLKPNFLQNPLEIRWFFCLLSTKCHENHQNPVILSTAREKRLVARKQNDHQQARMRSFSDDMPYAHQGNQSF